MKISYRTINNRAFMETLAGLGGQVLPGEHAFAVKKVVEEIGKIEMAARKLLMDLFNLYAEKGPEGQLQEDKETGVKILEAKKQEYAEHFAKFLDTEIEMVRKPIHVSYLKHASLSPDQIGILEPILTEVILVS